MHKIKLYLFLTLLSTTTIFCETTETKPKNDSQTNSNEQQSAPPNYYQRQLEVNIKKAIGSMMPYHKELYEHLYNQAPQEIKDCVELIQKAYNINVPIDVYTEVLPKRILLVGPPGVGKSMLAQIIACKLNRDFRFIKMPLLGNEYKNSEIETFAALVRDALDLKKPCVLILDEINIIAEKKYGLREDDLNIAAGLWVLLDACAKSPDILIIATANDVSKLPEQLKDRFEGNIFEIYSNNTEQRFQVLLFHLWKDMHYFNFSENYLLKLARKTDQFSPRQLEMLVRIAHQQQFLLTGSIDGVTEDQLEYAYQKILRSSNILKSKSHFNMRKWINENGPLIHTISTSVSLGVALFNIGYFILGNKNVRNTQPI